MEHEKKETIEKKEELIHQLSLALGLPISVFSGKEVILSSDHHRQNFNLPLYLASSLPEELPNLWTSHTPEHIYMGGIYSGKYGCYLLIAPVFTYECSYPQAKQILQRLGRKTDSEYVLNFQKTMNSYSRCDIHRLQSILTLLYGLINETDRTEAILSIPFTWSSFFPEQTFEPVIPEIPVSPMNPETQMISMVKYGKEKDLAEFFDKILFQSNAVFDIPQDLHEERLYLYGGNMLLSRLAIQAGVNSDYINSLVKYYYYELEKAASHTDLSYCFYNFTMRYTRLIAKQQLLTTDSMLANTAISYIRAHLYEPLRLSVLAEALHTSDSHLCREFKKFTNKTITAYINECKITEACYLLEKHHFKPAAVSDMLCFSSPGYFGKVFKNITGTTPALYLKTFDKSI